MSIVKHVLDLKTSIWATKLNGVSMSKIVIWYQVAYKNCNKCQL